MDPIYGTSNHQHSDDPPKGSTPAGTSRHHGAEEPLGLGISGMTLVMILCPQPRYRVCLRLPVRGKTITGRGDTVAVRYRNGTDDTCNVLDIGFADDRSMWTDDTVGTARYPAVLPDAFARTGRLHAVASPLLTVICLPYAKTPDDTQPRQGSDHDRPPTGKQGACDSINSCPSLSLPACSRSAQSPVLPLIRPPRDGLYVSHRSARIQHSQNPRSAYRPRTLVAPCGLPLLRSSTVLRSRS